MIRARVADIRYERRYAPLYGMQGQVDHVNMGADIELRVSLFDDGTGVGIGAHGIQILEEAIEQALNGTVVTRLVPVEEALPPGPRRIVL
jgi:hypothetical protein